MYKCFSLGTEGIPIPLKDVLGVSDWRWTIGRWWATHRCRTKTTAAMA